MIDRQQLPGSRLFILFLSASVALAPLSIDMYMPAMPQMALAFGVNFSEINLTMSAYLFGNAIGQFFGGALSDQIGRKKIGVTGLSIFCLASLAIAFSSDIQSMQLLRVVQAIGGGFATVICIAQVRDIFPPHEVMKRYADVIMVMMIAPIVAPTFGVALVQFGWQSIFFVLAFVSLGMLLINVFVMPETRLNVSKRIDASKLFPGYWAVINHRVDGRITAIRYALYAGFSTGVFFCFLTNAAMIFMQHYHFGQLQFALGFATVGMAMVVGNRLAVRMASKMAPERWLQAATSAQILCCLLLVGLSASGLLNAWITAVVAFLIVAMSGSIMPTTSARFISYFDQNAGSAASLATTISFSFGALIGALGAMLAEQSITPVFVIMLASSVVALIILQTIHPTGDNLNGNLGDHLNDTVTANATHNPTSNLTKS